MGSTVRDTLENALYLSISDREFSPVDPTGSKINAALNVYVDLLDVYRNQVPFLSQKEIQGEDELENINASLVNFVEYVLGNVVYELKQLSQSEFARISTVIDLRTVPEFYWHDEQENRVRVYPLPQSVNDKFIIGYRPALSVSTLSQPLPAEMPAFMKIFLEYETAKTLCDQYSVPWTPQKEASRQKYEAKLVENSQNNISCPVKRRLKSGTGRIPWLAYISGNTP